MLQVNTALLNCHLSFQFQRQHPLPISLPFGNTHSSSVEKVSERGQTGKKLREYKLNRYFYFQFHTSKDGFSLCASEMYSAIYT